MTAVEATAPGDLHEELAEVSKIIDGIADPNVSRPITNLIARLTERIEEIEDEENIEGLTREAVDAQDAINRFLDVVDRPCGTRKFIIPETGERDRALIGLYDAIGRRL